MSEKSVFGLAIIIESIFAAAAVRYSAPILPGFSGASTTNIMPLSVKLSRSKVCVLLLTIAMIFSDPERMLVTSKTDFLTLKVSTSFDLFRIFEYTDSQPSSTKKAFSQLFKSNFGVKVTRVAS